MDARRLIDDWLAHHIPAHMRACGVELCRPTWRGTVDLIRQQYGDAAADRLSAGIARLEAQIGPELAAAEARRRRMAGM